MKKEFKTALIILGVVIIGIIVIGGIISNNNQIKKEQNICQKNSDCKYIWQTGGCHTIEYVEKIMDACQDGSGPCPSEAESREGVTCTCENQKCVTHG